MPVSLWSPRQGLPDFYVGLWSSSVVSFVRHSPSFSQFPKQILSEFSMCSLFPFGLPRFVYSPLIPTVPNKTLLDFSSESTVLRRAHPILDPKVLTDAAIFFLQSSWFVEVNKVKSFMIGSFHIEYARCLLWLCISYFVDAQLSVALCRFPRNR